MNWREKKNEVKKKSGMKGKRMNVKIFSANS